MYRKKYVTLAVNRLVQEKTRKDSVKFVGTIITASPEFFKNRPPREVEEYFRRAVDFLSGEVGRRNIFSATVHMEKRTPHMHLCFVPLTKDNRLSAKEILGNQLVERYECLRDMEQQGELEMELEM